MKENNFLKSLYADSVNKNYREKLKIYENFIGSWEFEWVGTKEDGKTWSVPGEWHFSWILEGRAIQDNWICPKIDYRKNENYPDGEYGTTIRFYDSREECVKVIWFGPILSNINIFKASQIENGIIQNEIMSNDKSKLSRWEFKDIESDSFKWESYISLDQGVSWERDKEVFAKSLTKK